MNFKDTISNNISFFLSFVTILVIGSIAVPAVAHKGATGIVKERMDYFDRNKDNLKAIQGYLKKEDYQSIVDELKNWVAKEIGPIAKPEEIRFGDNLPKTRSGKIMRRLLRTIAKGEEITADVSTLENPKILEQLSEKI